MLQEDMTHLEYDHADEQDVRISDKTVARMRWYLQALDDFAGQGISTAASREIAERVGVKPGLVRKDLCHFGGFGRPSVGYNVDYLRKKIRDILRMNCVRKIVWVGAQRLAEDPGLPDRLTESRCEIVGVFDGDPAKVGMAIGSLQILDMHGMETRVRELGAEAAVIAVRGADAQAAADSLVAGGVKAILNLSPAVIAVPAGVIVRNMDIAGELMLLSYHAGENRHEIAESDIIL